MNLRIPFLFLLTTVLAHAHAFLDHAEPKVGATLAASPTAVKIWFTKEVGPGSGIAVTDSSGSEVDNHDLKLDPADKKLLVVTLPPLRPGTYTVTWHAVAWDSHHTKGSFTFTINPR